MAQLNVIDIASYQSTLVPSAVPADAIIIKVTEGTGYINPTWKKQADQTLAAGQKLGLYHFINGLNGTAQADYFVKSVKPYIGKALLVLDFENTDGSNVRSSAAVAQGLAFLNRVVALTGVRPLVYMNTDFEQNLDWSAVVKGNFGLWVAQYDTTSAITGFAPREYKYALKHWSTLAMFQYHDNTHISGYSGGLDASVFYGDATAWDKYAATSSKPTITAKPSTPKPSKPAASKPVAKPAAKAVNVMYGFHQLGGGWLGEVTNFGSGDNGYAGVPNKANDYFYAKATRGNLKFRVHTVKSGWLSWITKGNKADLVNGCAGIKGETIDAVELIYTTPAGEPYQQAYYRSQTTKRAGYLGVVCDDGKSLPAFKDTYAGIIGEPMDRLQVKIATANPF